MDKILVIVEHKNGLLKKVSQQILGFISDFCRQSEKKILVLIYGEKIAERLFEEVASWGADEIITIENQCFANYNPAIFIPTIADVIKKNSPQLVFFGNTAVGRDLSPRLAQYFNTYMISDVIDIKIEKDKFCFTRPVYGGKLFEEVETNGELVFVTVRPNSFGNSVNYHKNPHIYNIEPKAITNFSYMVSDILKKESEEKSLSEAEIIVSGGKGLKSAENFVLLEELAQVLGAAVGASRSAVDAGWRPYSSQVGQTGKTVKPKLYIACGISGAMQHLAGMSTSQVIVAINKDPEAPIFKVADYGIIGDLFEIVPVLTEELKKIFKD